MLRRNRLTPRVLVALASTCVACGGTHEPVHVSSAEAPAPVTAGPSAVPSVIPTASAVASSPPPAQEKGGTVVSKLLVGGGSVNAGRIAIDSKGNRYVTGSFHGNVTFGDLKPLAAIGEDAFLLKLDPANKPLWAKRFGGSGSDAGLDVVLDSDGGVFLSGHFDSASIEIGSAKHPNIGVHDVFLAKLDADGKALWSKSYGDAADQMDMHLTPYPGGGIIASGWFSGGMGFAGLPTRSPFDKAFYVARIDSDGHGRWAHAYGHRIDYVETDSVVDGQGNIFVSGGSDGTPDFKKGGFPSAVDDLGPVLVKLDPDGKTLSARRFGRGADNLTTGVAIDKKGNLRYASASRGVTSFDGDERKPVSGESLVVAGFDSSGALSWHREIFTSQLLSIAGTTIDGSGNFYVAGQFNAEDPARGSTREAGYIVKIGDTGEIAWTLKIIDGTMAWLSGIAFDPSGHLIAVGSVAGADPAANGQNQLWIGTIAP